MRSRECRVVMMALCCVVTLARADAEASTEITAPPAMSASAVRAAASAVAADPLLAGAEKTRTLRFKRDEDEKKKPSEPNDTSWWRDLFGSLSAGLRVAMWLVGASLLVLLLLRLRDWLGGRSGGATLRALPPTHVGSLDIRPESLPADIGGAARTLWQRGEQRAALSLMYRGALSRLVHGHGVPIRAASTERECLTLAGTRLAPAAQSYLAQLVAGWQAVAYAQRQLSPDDLEQLCQGFDAQLPAQPPAVAKQVPA